MSNNFHKEVANFKMVNGNKDYKQGDMLSYLCSKIDKIDTKIDDLHVNISDINIRLGAGDKDFSWLKISMYFGFGLIGLLFCLVFTLNGVVPNFW